MKVLGITGGVGAGKSTMLAYLQSMYNSRVIQADQVAHYLMEPGQPCYYKVIEQFGSGVLNGDQTIHRGKLSKMVFGQYDRLEKLNRIVHPAVKEYIVKEIEVERRRGDIPFMVVEAALLLEDHYDVICDEIWYIYASEEVRKERLMKSRGYTDDKIKGIMKNQMKDASFRKFCQFVVDNSSNIVENTYEQIDRGLVEHEFL